MAGGRLASAPASMCLYRFYSSTLVARQFFQEKESSKLGMVPGIVWRPSTTIFITGVVRGVVPTSSLFGAIMTPTGQVAIMTAVSGCKFLTFGGPIVRESHRND